MFTEGIDEDLESWLLPQPPTAKTNTRTTAIAANIAKRFIIFSFPGHMPACLIDLIDYNVHDQYWQLQRGQTALTG
jgi:hypothetical protein